MDPLEQALKAITDRITALEQKPAIDPAAVEKAVNDHPVMARISAFLDKWQRGGAKPTA